jgi:hypothetical protein
VAEMARKPDCPTGAQQPPEQAAAQPAAPAPPGPS